MTKQEKNKAESRQAGWDRKIKAGDPLSRRIKRTILNWISYPDHPNILLYFF